LLSAGCGAKLQLLEVDIMKKLYRGEHNEVLTYEMLVEEYQRQLENRMTEATTIEEYLENCLKSALEEITDKDILTIADELELDTDQITELIELIESDATDFELAGARIIHKDCIDKIQQEELLSDLYCLGCFNANFLADYLPLDVDHIEQLQKAEVFTAIGKIAAKYIKEIQEGYAAADGYGHHFNGYDFSEIETDHYYVFPRAAE
jgi:hypothetical protein